MPLTSERIKEILNNQPNFYNLFLVRALEELLGETAFNAIIDEMVPETVNAQATLFGRKLGDYMGLDRATIKEKFTRPDGTALTDDDVDDIFAAAGIVSGTSAPTPLGSGVKEAKQDKKDAKQREASGKPDAAPKPSAQPNKGTEKDESKKSS